MAFLIDTIDSSGLFAQSANSATIATKDSNGNDITATYQPIGDYYSASNPSGFITGVPNTYLQNTDLSVTDGKITGISGVPISAGGSTEIYSYDLSAGANINITKDDANSAIGIEVTGLSAYQPSGDYYSASNPSGFMTELPASATDVIDTVTANSGSWGGSALPISAGPGIKVNLVDNTLIFSNDETVLYSGTQTYSAILSESVKNFQKIAIEYGPNNYYNIPQATFNTDYFADNDSNSGVHLEFVEHNGTNVYCFPKTQTFVWHNNFTNLDAVGGLQYRVSGNAIQSEATGNMLYIRKVIGINRIAGGN